MTTVLKFVLFCLFVYAMAIGFYRVYRLLNEKIIGGQTLLQVLGFAVLLIVANLFLFTTGLFLFIKLYDYLSLSK